MKGFLCWLCYLRAKSYLRTELNMKADLPALHLRTKDLSLPFLITKLLCVEKCIAGNELIYIYCLCNVSLRGISTL